MKPFKIQRVIHLTLVECILILWLLFYILIQQVCSINRRLDVTFVLNNTA